MGIPHLPTKGLRRSFENHELGTLPKKFKMFKSRGFVFLLLLVSVIYHATPSSASNIQERVIKVIVEQVGVDESEIKPESSLVDDLGADDLDVIELVMGIEEEFDIEVP